MVVSICFEANLFSWYFKKMEQFDSLILVLTNLIASHPENLPNLTQFGLSGSWIFVKRGKWGLELLKEPNLRFTAERVDAKRPGYCKSDAKVTALMFYHLLVCWNFLISWAIDEVYIVFFLVSRLAFYTH